MGHGDERTAANAVRLIRHGVLCQQLPDWNLRFANPADAKNDNLDPPPFSSQLTGPVPVSFAVPVSFIRAGDRFISRGLGQGDERTAANASRLIRHGVLGQQLPDWNLRFANPAYPKNDNLDPPPFSSQLTGHVPVSFAPRFALAKL